MTKTAVSVLGLGSMGHRLAEALLEAGHPVTVWNRSAGKADDLVARGAVLAPTAGEAVAASPIVIVCLLNYDIAHAILGPQAGQFAGRTLVNLTNGTPEEARVTASWAAVHGIPYVDGGIMATPPMIGRPEAFIVYSGSRSGFDEHAATLEVLGAARYVGDEPGLASLYDLALLSGMYGMFGGIQHATRLVGTRRAAEFAAGFLVPWLRAVAEVDPDAMDDDSPLSMQAVALANIVQASRGEGLDDATLTHLLTPMADIVEAGHDDLLPALIKEILAATT
ncbi:NAD(P)-dependent oxidoreductase [Spirillospora sp. CA-294931]|uniref:NAD(P)-dependent oxidoreductase n=1 Tax=Spirillospora sp. CA-294931 TaxID=3240042 RepID=UPI003D8C8F8B